MAKFWLISPIIFAFGLMPIAFIVLRKGYEDMKLSLLEDLKNLEGQVGRLNDENERLNAEVIKLDKQNREIAGLYEITKEMSSALSFGEIFQIFGDFLRKNFKFIACKLILIERDKKTTGRIYKVEAPADNRNVMRAQIAMQELAIPLISQNETIGVLNVEGLEEEALEKFMIVARQFSLEIEKVRLYETVQELAITDGATGVFVRRYFLEILKEEFERSLMHNFKMSFLMIDLDHFKECNDAFGHLVGDFILKEIARILRQNVREIDFIGRYGGEEFSLLLPETDKTSAGLVAERLRAAVASQGFKAYDEFTKMTISIGLSTFPEDAKNISELIDFADKALYEAKAQGRNRVIAFKGGVENGG